MSADPAEIERRLKSCLSEIEGLRSQRLTLRSVSHPDSSVEEWDRRARLALLKGKIKALEAEYTSLRFKKAVAELDAHLERESGRAKLEADANRGAYILGDAGNHIVLELEEADRRARRKLRAVQVCYMTDNERRRREQRLRVQRRERRRHEHGHER